MNISVEYYNLSDDDIPMELYLPKFRIDNELFIDEKVRTNSSTTLPNVKKINFFIGANNSGKSRFLRGLIKLNKERIFYTKETKSLLKRVEEINKSYSILKDSGLLDPESFKSNLNFYEKPNFFNDPLNGIFNYKGNYWHYSNLLTKFREEIVQNGTFFTFPELKNFTSEFLLFNNEIKYCIENTPLKKTYIPVLRHLNSRFVLTKKIYDELLERNYNFKPEYLFTGLSLYDDIRELNGAEYEVQVKKDNFELFLSENFFKKRKVKLIAANSSEIRLFIDGEGDREIYNVGDGIQSLILILFPIFMAREKEWLFIEEPETHLHPGYQRIFLDAILNDEYVKSKNLRLFFTTHSNHFLDQSLTNDDVSIFQFKKENKDLIDIKTNVKPSKEALDLLGVSNSSVLIANSSIWVEGPTDRKYISKWLSLYPEFNLKEDIDYAFFEYGGNLIAHYLFDENFEESEEVREQINSFAISNHIYLLADNDNPVKGSKKEKRRSELEKLSKKSKNFFYQNTKVKEIENLLPVQVLRDFLPELIKNTNHSKTIDKISFTRNNYENEGLGDFFEELLIQNKIPKKDLKSFKIKSNSGTLTGEYKKKLCNLAISNKYEYQDFIKDNDVLKEIIEDLYNFIKPKT